MMLRRNVFAAMVVGLTVSLSFIFCGAASAQGSGGSPINTLVQRIKQNPKDTDAWKRLGVVLLQAKRYDVSLKCFQRALKLNSRDAEAFFYLGRSYEFKNQKSQALAAYSKYADLAESEFRDRMEERYIVLKRETAGDEAKKLLEDEEAIGSRNISPQAVAVLPFPVLGGDAKLSSLGKGVAEMLITDLSQIPSLTLVERIRVQSLFDEMALGQAGMVEESQAAKFGKMLAAGRVVRGGLAVSQQNKLRMEASMLDVMQNRADKPVAVADAFANLFRAEKELAFKVLGKMGIDPTPEQRQRILKVPTQNIQAFIAYCNGLDLEDKGEFQKAAAQFQKALQLDPQYSKAGQKLNESQVLQRAGGAAGFRPETGDRTDLERAAVSGFDPEALVSERLNTEQRNLGSNFMLGKDVRTAQEVDAKTTESVIEDLSGGANLPEPPDPPPSVPLNRP